MNRMKIFCEGMLTATIAHFSAWVALVSVERIVQLSGHIFVVLAVHVLSSGQK
jgi:hypothetical protein